MSCRSLSRDSTAFPSGDHMSIIACGKITWHGSTFAGGEPVVDFISGLREVDSEECEAIFRHEQTISVHGFGIRPGNTSSGDLDFFFFF